MREDRESSRSRQRNKKGGDKAVEWAVDGVEEGSRKLVGRRVGVVLESKYGSLIKNKTKQKTPQYDNYSAMQWQ